MHSKHTPRFQRLRPRCDDCRGCTLDVRIATKPLRSARLHSASCLKAPASAGILSPVAISQRTDDSHSPWPAKARILQEHCSSCSCHPHTPTTFYKDWGIKCLLILSSLSLASSLPQCPNAACGTAENGLIKNAACQTLPSSPAPGPHAIVGSRDITVMGLDLTGLLTAIVPLPTNGVEPQLHPHARRHTRCCCLAFSCPSPCFVYLTLGS